MYNNAPNLMYGDKVLWQKASKQEADIKPECQ